MIAIRIQIASIAKLMLLIYNAYLAKYIIYFKLPYCDNENYVQRSLSYEH